MGHRLCLQWSEPLEAAPASCVVFCKKCLSLTTFHASTNKARSFSRRNKHIKRAELKVQQNQAR